MPVVDASVVVDWVAPEVDPDGPATRALRRVVRDGDALMAPALMLQEVANALLTGVRRRRWDGAAADTAFEALRRMPVTIAGNADDLVRAWDLSRRFDEHPVYDMVYVALAERIGHPLVTADEALVRRMAGRGSVVHVGQWADA